MAPQGFIMNMWLMKQKTNLNQVLKRIKENPKIVFNQDVYTDLGISATTYYRRYPTDSDAYNEIQEALEANKTLMKREIRDRLAECKNPSGLVVLYRLLATDAEMDALNSIFKAKNEENTKITLKID